MHCRAFEIGQTEEITGIGIKRDCREGSVCFPVFSRLNSLWLKIVRIMFWETAVFYGAPDGERTDYINCFQIVQAGQGCGEGG